MISRARHAPVAAFAALLASVGDLLLLWVANAPRSELGLPSPGPVWLWIGGALGVAAIPFYALGYRSAADSVAAASGRAARTVFVAGAGGALVGAVIHGVTTFQISAQAGTAASSDDPLASLLGSAPLLALWGVASALVVVASLVFSWQVVRGETAMPRAAALFNPAFVTVALALAGLPTALLQAFLVPAAPNLAHLVFFAVCARGSGAQVAGKPAPGSSPITLSRVAESERPALERLVDVYLAEHRETPAGPTDAASYAYLPYYWVEAGRHPFFLVVDGVRVGFVLVREVPAEGVIEMSEFYLRPESRRAGLGRAALAEVWRRFPGAWRLQFHPNNAAAAVFWPRCIEASAAGEVRFREVIEEDGRRIEYRFEISPS